MLVSRSQEHDVSNYRQRRTKYHKDAAALDLPAPQARQDTGDRAKKIWGYREKLLISHRLVWEDGLDNGWQKKRHAVYGDAVEQESYRRHYNDGVYDAEAHLGPAEFVFLFGGCVPFLVES